MCRYMYEYAKKNLILVQFQTMLDPFYFTFYRLRIHHIYFTERKKCRMSNADCTEHEDCCSGSCVQAHEGTDPRCMPSPMHYPCFSSYQCEHGLACGDQYSCCSPFWGICTEQDDCCDQENHVCRPEEGYIYKSCLKPKHSHVADSSMQLLTIIMIISSMHILYWSLS